jgi:hypothetical protein
VQVKKLFLSRYSVLSDSGNTYFVDTAKGSCTCKDALYRPKPEGCKHVRAAASWSPSSPRGGQASSPAPRG